MGNVLVKVSTKDDVKVEGKSNCYITLSPKVYAELAFIIDSFDSEVSGCGMVDRVVHKFVDKDGKETRDIEFKITEIILPTEQDNSGASTDIDEEVIAKLLTELVKQGKDAGKLKLHWHSHNDMDTFHSGTDEDNYETLLRKDYLVSLVLNKNMSILGRVDLLEPFTMAITGVPVYMLTEVPDNVNEECKKSVKALKKYAEEHTKVNYYSGGDYNSDWRGDRVWDIHEQKWVDKAGITKSKKKKYARQDDYKGSPNYYREFLSEVKELVEEYNRIYDPECITIEEGREFLTCPQTNCVNCAKANACDDFLYSVTSGGMD